MELHFTINSDHSSYPNRISIPVLKVNLTKDFSPSNSHTFFFCFVDLQITYGEVNITNVKGKPSDLYLYFRIRIRFSKSYAFSSMLDVRKTFIFAAT